MILLEAMALETPIIAHAVGGIPNLLNNGDCGILVNYNRADSYTQALHKLLCNTKKSQTITHNALERVMKFYSAEKIAQAHIKLYSEICSPKTGAERTKNFT
jgi:glycosyltransferase involved in cell wall biosynthesis